MTTHTIQAGYLPTTHSKRYHPVQNVTIKSSDENKTINIIYKDLTVRKITDNKEHKIIMSQDNNYNILLKLDDVIIITNQHLFHVDLEVIHESSNNYIETYKGMIYDC
jgi:hypothetical protein